MRLSKPRLILRAALLVFLAAFMAWRASDTGVSAAGPGLDVASARLLGRIAVVEWILAALALLTAGVVALALRPKARRRALQLGDHPAAPAGPPAAPAGDPAAPAGPPAGPAS